LITRIEAYRYRCFERLAVDIGTYNVLAGANGSGKSTLLDIPALLGNFVSARECGAAFLERQPSRRVPRAHALDELIHQGRGDSFSFAIEAKLPSQIVNQIVESTSPTLQRNPGRWPSDLRYEVLLRIFNQQLQVDHEYLYLFPERYRPELGSGLQRRGLWAAGEPKSADPKKAIALRGSRRRIPQSGALYRRIANVVTTRGCTDPAFLKLMATLRVWFPPRP
jgi:energy-coupling factor transporter ATP-binding protein EcfA2